MSALLKFFTGRSNAETETFLAASIEKAGFTAADIKTAADSKNFDFLSQSVAAAASALTAERDAERAKATDLSSRISAIESAAKAAGLEIESDKISDAVSFSAAVEKRITAAASQQALTIVQSRGIPPVPTTQKAGEEPKGTLTEQCLAANRKN